MTENIFDEKEAIISPLEDQSAEHAEKDLDLSDLLSGADFTPKKLFIKELNGNVYIKPMKAADRDKYEYSAKNDKNAQKAFRLILVQRCACNKDGLPLFPTAEQVGRVSSIVIETIWMECMKACGFIEKDAEFIEKN